MRVEQNMDYRQKPPAFLEAPLKNPWVLSPYGRRGQSFHTGIDVRNKASGDNKVLAAGTGRITKVGKMRGYGQLIAITHEKGYVTRYAHLKEFLVKPGQWVKSGEPIGVMGKSGRATAIHLHFEIIDPSGNFIDPGPLFK